MNWAETCVTMAITKRSNYVNKSKTTKNSLSPDFCLQFDKMKQESLVIVDQKATVKSYLSFVLTARHATEISYALNKKKNLINKNKVKVT